MFEIDEMAFFFSPLSPAAPSAPASAGAMLVTSTPYLLLAGSGAEA
jgi:hypothetical protein